MRPRFTRILSSPIPITRSPGCATTGQRSLDSAELPLSTLCLIGFDSRTCSLTGAWVPANTRRPGIFRAV